MAESSSGQERTEEPTPRRLEKARQEGQVARSRELTTVALVGFAAVGLLLWFPAGARALLAFAQECFAGAGLGPGTAVPGSPMQDYAALDFQAALRRAMYASATAIGPLLALLFVVAIASTGALGGFLFSTKAMAFKGERLSPIKGFQRIFSVQALVELAKSIGKFLLISGAAIAFLWQTLDTLFALGHVDVAVALPDGLSYVSGALLLFAVVLALIAAIDVPFQVAQHRKKLKMTRQEVKDELKDSEGKPEVKAAQRRAQQSLANQRMLDAVPTADVVITNPEHFAVALRYEPGAAAPTVVASGIDHLALRIRAVADRHQVPQLRVPALARSIYYHCRPGETIPAALFAAVAQ
ncbi:MAG: flagellar type III secretion system protein FlhB, partial [Pseudomonadota bacterium]